MWPISFHIMMCIFFQQTYPKYSQPNNGQIREKHHEVPSTIPSRQLPTPVELCEALKLCGLNASEVSRGGINPEDQPSSLFLEQRNFIWTKKHRTPFNGVTMLWMFFDDVNWSRCFVCCVNLHFKVVYDYVAIVCLYCNCMWISVYIYTIYVYISIIYICTIYIYTHV